MDGSSSARLASCAMGEGTPLVAKRRSNLVRAGTVGACVGLAVAALVGSIATILATGWIDDASEMASAASKAPASAVALHPVQATAKTTSKKRSPAVALAETRPHGSSARRESLLETSLDEVEIGDLSCNRQTFSGCQWWVGGQPMFMGDWKSLANGGRDKLFHLEARRRGVIVMNSFIDGQWGDDEILELPSMDDHHRVDWWVTVTPDGFQLMWEGEVKYLYAHRASFVTFSGVSQDEYANIRRLDRCNTGNYNGCRWAISGERPSTVEWKARDGNPMFQLELRSNRQIRVNSWRPYYGWYGRGTMTPPEGATVYVSVDRNGWRVGWGNNNNRWSRGHIWDFSNWKYVAHPLDVDVVPLGDGEKKEEVPRIVPIAVPPGAGGPENIPLIPLCPPGFPPPDIDPALLPPGMIDMCGPPVPDGARPVEFFVR